MNRYGYLSVAALLITLLVYVLWPQSEDGYEPIWQGDIPSRYTLVLGEFVQEVEDGQVQLQGLQRPLEESAHTRMWQVFSSARSQRWRDDVAESDLSAFGIGQRQLYAPGIDLRWGHRDEHTYIYNGSQQRLHIMRRSTYDSFERSVGRLDQQAVLTRVDPVHGLRIDQLQLGWDAGQERWLDQDALHRPPFDPRVEDLLMALRRLRVSDLEPQVQDLTPRHQITITFADGHEQQVSFSEDAQGQWWVHGDAVPPQRLSLANRAAIRERLAAFAQDHLVHIPLRSADPTIFRVEVWREGEWWFALEGDEDLAGERLYEVLWSGGRDPATVRALWNLQQALNELSVSQVQARSAQDISASQMRQAIHIRAWDRREQLLTDLRLSEQQAFTDHYLGQIDQLPAGLAELSPDAFLDRRLLPSSLQPERVEKFQRVRYDTNSAAPSAPATASADAEVFVRGEGGWRSTFPADRSVDQRAIGRVIEGIVSAQAERAWLPRQRLPSDPQLSIALRIAGAADEDGRSEVSLLDTFDRDWGLRLFQRQDGDWDAYEVERGFRYHLEDDVVQGWFAPLNQLPILPVLAHQVMHLRWQGGEQDFMLRRTSDNQWRLRLDGDEEPADEQEVRRLLRDLVALNAQEQRAQAAILADDETRLRLVVGIPGSELDAQAEQWIIAIGADDGERTLVSVHREGTRLTAQGRLWVESALLASIFAPAQRFRRLEHQPESDHE